jgi:hypothetical protein
MMSPSNTELKRLLGLLAETATKAEHEAYTAGWRDCRAAMLRAMAVIGDEPQAGHEFYNPLPEMNGAAAESSYTN